MKYRSSTTESYWTGKHVAGVMILLASIFFGTLSFIFGFALIIPWCFLPFVGVAALIGLVMLF